MRRDAEDARPWATTAAAPTPVITRLARAHRSRPTDAEKKLWRLLRGLELEGTHFRRQVVIGGYIADFACRRAKLVIEVDGGQHCESVTDVARTAEMEALGWRVLRFWNNEVLLNPQGVRELVVEALRSNVGASFGTTPTPDPSPQGGGGNGEAAAGSFREAQL
ncbi:endonuclease domain-containing protein [Chenggangzhangella methanolivorans]|uniref:endonuclease domain-containing protein n=1 Tax=Chenggangzhangella methanolivorans TaxID=1437009 RepID=UPI00361D2A63